MTNLEFKADENGQLEIELSRPFGDETPQVRAFATRESFGLVVDGLDPGEILDVETEPFKRRGKKNHRRECIKSLRRADRITDEWLQRANYQKVAQDIDYNTICGRFGSFTDALQMAGVSRRMVDACPNCDLTNIRSRETVEPEYICQLCDCEFDEPRTRPSKRL